MLAMHALLLRIAAWRGGWGLFA